MVIRLTGQMRSRVFSSMVSRLFGLVLSRLCPNWDSPGRCAQQFLNVGFRPRSARLRGVPEMSTFGPPILDANARARLGDDRIELSQRLAVDVFCEPSERAALGIRKQNAPSSQSRPKRAILGF
jgi:hypothetical protein